MLIYEIMIIHQKDFIDKVLINALNKIHGNGLINLNKYNLNLWIFA